MADPRGGAERPVRGADVTRQAQENLEASRQLLRLLEEALRRGRAVLEDPGGDRGDPDSEGGDSEEGGEGP